MPKLQGLPPIKANRCCGNCGCYYTVANTEVAGAPVQGFCLKDPPNYGKVRVMVPRVNVKTGQPDIDPKTHKVIEVPTEQAAYSFRPTLPELYCMDGWRSQTAKPGESAAQVRSREMMEGARPMLEDLGSKGKIPAEFVALCMAFADGAAKDPESLESDSPSAANEDPSGEKKPN